MSLTTAPIGAPEESTESRHETHLLWAFTGTLFLSALLLFSVQPMFAKMVLPKLGGSPSVWAVAMCFFQAVLLLGYCYAHTLNRFLDARHAFLVHLGVLGVTLLALPIALPMAWGEPPEGDAYGWLIGLFAFGVGLPFFAVSANAPLLQSWFARSGHPHGSDPYFLYGASNIGSLVALLCYPIVLEPMFGLQAQSGTWSIGFSALGIAIFACGYLALMLRPEQAERAGRRAGQAPAVTVRQRFTWLGLAFVPSALVIAMTTHITTDIASAPFIWVVPLAMFLGTFVMVFRDEPIIPHEALLIALPILVATVFVSMAMGSILWALGGIAGMAAFFVAALVAHRELYLARPAAQHLTEFYLIMSLGGVLGGVFASLFAPNVFNTVAEYPLLMALTLACHPGIRSGAKDLFADRKVLLALAASVGVIVLAYALQAWELLPSVIEARTYGVLAMAGVVVLARGKPGQQLAFALIAVLASQVLSNSLHVMHVERSFFGVVWVSETADGEVRQFNHGTTLHGAERIRTRDGKAMTETIPTTYYYPGSPMSKAVKLVQDTRRDKSRRQGFGIVGLGVGSLACYSQPREDWVFYEIDPAVVRIARDSRYFSFMPKCGQDTRIVLGDARLKLAKEKPAAFDLLVIDAFSSDSVPVHLLTKEALALYGSKLQKDGVLALHISNRHLDLYRPLTASIKAAGLPDPILVQDLEIGERKDVDGSASLVMLVTADPERRAILEKWSGASKPATGGVRAWTDDFSDVLGALLRHYF